MKQFWLLSLAGLALATTASAAISDPVRIETGQISGATLGSGVRAFKGIPYAAPPVGDLRWKAPQPAADWAGVRKAEAFSPVCMQNRRAEQTPQPSEDCLYLNVWSSADTASAKRPVFFWIYGGGFYTGSGSEPRYDGEALAKKGLVVVTINYRLGMFGFFSHPELSKESGHNSSGNYGVMDMVAALKWTQKNIAKFGGDPGNVTIAGESAGAIAVAALVGSPEGKGLFKRAISQSGAWMGINIAKTTTLAQAEEAGAKVASDMGATSIAQLRAMPADELFKKGKNGGLIIDGKYITDDLSNIFLHKKQNDVDVLVGSNHDEGTFFVRAGQGSAGEFLTQTKDRFGSAADSFLKTHPATSDDEAYNSRLTSVRDEMGWHMRTYAQVQSERGKAKAYLYYFTRIPPSAPGQPSRGATHTAELRYMFNNLGDDPKQPVTDIDRKVADEMSSYWVNFATSGNPNGKGLPEWPAYNAKTSTQPMVFGDTVGMGSGIDSGVLAFFDNYYAKQ